jgi:hypothetical protein
MTATSGTRSLKPPEPHQTIDHPTSGGNSHARPSRSISRPTMPHPDKQHVTVNGIRMAYLETGSGKPIVFLQGNPTI